MSPTLREYAPGYISAVTGSLIALAREADQPVIAQLLEGVAAIARDHEHNGPTPTRSIEGSWSLVPAHIRDRLDAHIGRGEHVGGFLTAVLSNDLHRAVSRADDVNLHRLHGLMTFLHMDAPSECWGSPERVSAWRAQGGLVGRTGAAA